MLNTKEKMIHKASSFRPLCQIISEYVSATGLEEIFSFFSFVPITVHSSFRKDCQTTDGWILKNLLVRLVGVLHCSLKR